MTSNIENNDFKMTFNIHIVCMYYSIHHIKHSMENANVDPNKVVCTGTKSTSFTEIWLTNHAKHERPRLNRFGCCCLDDLEA